LNDFVRPPYRFGFLSVGLFVAALLWFGVCLNWHLTVSIMLPVTSVLTCLGLTAGVVGILPGNPGRAVSAFGAIINGGGLVFVVNRWWLWGI
jgi:hypothetical protein